MRQVRVVCAFFLKESMMDQLNVIKASDYVGFGSIQDALNHQATHGGWVFESDCGSLNVCFNTTFTPTKIIAHPVTKGVSGRLL